MRWGFRVTVLSALSAVLLFALAPIACATVADIYAQSKYYVASTYSGHGLLSGFGAPLDLNGCTATGGYVQDSGWPIFAPGPGSAAVYSTADGNGWGNSVIWTSRDGKEQIFMAHLSKFGQKGAVAGGAVIGYVGTTGNSSGPHIHIQRRYSGSPAALQLSGKTIVAGRKYASGGPDGVSPTGALTTPAADAIIPATWTCEIAGQFTDAFGVAKVNFYWRYLEDSPSAYRLIGSDATASSDGRTYGVTWSYVLPKARTVVVRAIPYDKSGNSNGDITCSALTTDSAPVRLVVTAVEGPNRYATAIAASQKAFPSGSEYVIVATGMNWPDALGGSALAGALDAPILLTAQSSLPAEVRSEIVRLSATKAIVLGGTPAVSAAVAGEIDAIAGVSVERIAGANRYDTANLVAARTIAVMRAGTGYDGTAFVATGMNFPDALGASPLAARQGWPIYLANPAQGANAGLVAVMRAAGVSKAIVLGGTNVVASSVESALSSLGPVTRLAGANRYDTAVMVATYGVANAGLSWDKLAIATGTNFPDALAGGVLQGKSNSVLLLTPTTSLNDGVAAVLRANKATVFEVRFLGSTAAVSQTVRTAVWNDLTR